MPKTRQASTIHHRQPINQEVLKHLYLQKQLSLSEIANRLNCSANKVVYWMERHRISRRSRDEANYIKHNPTGNPFTIRKPVTASERELFQLVIGLYIGEGTKAKHRVVLANADPQVIRTFLLFLRGICGVDEKRIYAYLNIFDDVDLNHALEYWQRVTKLKPTQFVKPTIRSNKGGSYKNPSRYGTLTIGVSNTKLSRQINNWYEEALEKFAR